MPIFLKKFFACIIISCILFGITQPLTVAQAQEQSLTDYTAYFYNRYSTHFDTIGLKYKSPTYGLNYFKTAETPREIMSLVSYYKYRVLNGEKNAIEILKKQINIVYQKLLSQKNTSQSFEDAEALFLLVQMNNLAIKDFPIITPEQINQLIKEKIRPGILAKDTENRAVVAGAHWQYLANYIFERGVINELEKNELDKLIKNKIDLAIKNSINSTGWYKENNGQSFSVHYHTVSAFMLMFYGSLTNQENYLEIAKKMYYNVKKISFRNGMVEARLGIRPMGLGAQFYLMQGLLGNFFQDNDYQVYLFYGSGNRFFSDPKYPNRLEFHSTLEKTAPNFHDDYAFVDASELALTLPYFIFNQLDNQQTYFKNPLAKSIDKYFKIYNNGRQIIINNKKNVLGSYGNWSHIY